MPPAKPDRPSLCAVVGSDRVVMLDAGASETHARQFLDLLTLEGIASPQHIVLTHWHWDHVFGACEVGAPVIAHALTADKLYELSKRDWSDTGLKQQVAKGLETREGAENIKAEMPSPRYVNVPKADIVFNHSMNLKLGDVTCRIQHVGGDHSQDSTIVFVVPDRVLFLGDCLSSDFYAPEPFYTLQQLTSLLDTIESLNAASYVEGHAPNISTQSEFKKEISKMRYAIDLVREAGPDEKKVFTVFEETKGVPPDEDSAYYLRALIKGLSF